ncbi:MAG TPA: 7,8-didemethyl-8-hydroxy-5-deazariboflavin synthase subunit CofH [Methanosarcinaceae archaeon]|nr:7,8-didemethyl-8-hydroxy-5-deazariboflavin synthase subunit CofH [Methanosarcinaceae archaeon]
MVLVNSNIPDDIIQRSLIGECTKDDALQLLDAQPLELFSFANALREKAVGNTVTYIVNRNINFTNICVGTCGFCAFKANGNGGFRLSFDEIMEKVKSAAKTGSTEVCIQGGLLPDVGLDFYQEILETVKAEFPDMHIHAFSPMEVYHAARLSDMSVKDALVELKRSGLDTMPGTAAEILSDRVRNVICPKKLKTAEWVDVVTLAHKTGIPTTATIMYGHIETIEERIDHIMTIRNIQKQTGGFTEFVPLPFMPYNNKLGEELLRSGKFSTTGLEDLKLHAIARILLNTHVDNIQASWVKLGKKLAQFALSCGANDLGGTLMEEKISKSAGANHGEYMSPEEFKWLIRGAGRDPKQRTTLYRGV